MGTSIPIAAFPGIGASILTPVAAKFKAMSSVKFTIRLTFTPGPGWSSYRVNAGPTDTLIIFDSIPKLSKVLSSFLALSMEVVLIFFILFSPSFDLERSSIGG